MKAMQGGMSADTAQRHTMMTQHTEMMQMIMDMMSQRMPSAPGTR